MPKPKEGTRTIKWGLTNPRYATFVEEYVMGATVQDAGVRAGFKPSRASLTGSRLLAQEDIQAAVRECRAEWRRHFENQSEVLIRNLFLHATSDIRKVVRWENSVLELLDSDDLPLDVALTIQEIRQTKEGTTVKLVSKLDAIRQLVSILDLDGARDVDRERNDMLRQFLSVRERVADHLDTVRARHEANGADHREHVTPRGDSAPPG